jgi:tetratricopeptide (TPR) repeat protein
MPSTRELLDQFARQTTQLLSGAPPPGSGVPPPLVPGYVPVETLGRGGFGAVFRAVHIRGGEFAVKVLPAGEAFTPDGGDLVNNKVSHPNVVAVIAQGVSDLDDRPYLVTEYCGGDSLARRVDRIAAGERPFDSKEAAGVLAQLAGGLAAIHDAHFAHRDLTPNNILFAADGTPKIGDFGLARPIRPGLVVSGPVLGTPGYVPPEGYSATNADPRSDVYSLGAVGYAMLTGFPPLGPHVPNRAPAVTPLRDINPSVPRGLAAVIHRCLDPHPAHRFRSARALQKALIDCASGGWAIGPRVSVAVRRVARHLRRHWLPYLLAVGLVAGGAVWLASADQTARRERASADREHRLREDLLRESATATAAVEETIAQAEELGRYQPPGGGRPVLVRARGRLTERAVAAAEHPERAGEVADLFRRCGKLAFNLGDLDGAVDDYDRALHWAEADATGSEAARVRLAQVLREWGVTRAMRGKVADAKTAWERAFALLQPLADSHRDARFTLAQLHMVRANVALKAPDKQAEYATAERLLDGLLADAPNDRHARFALAEVLNNRAHLAPTASALDDCRRAVDIRRKLVEEFPNLPVQKEYLAASLNHLGNALRRADRRADARAAYTEARGLYQTLVAAYPGVVSNEAELKDVERNLAGVN